MLTDVFERLADMERKDRLNNDRNPKDVLCTLMLFVGGFTFGIHQGINPFVYLPTGNPLNPYLALAGSWLRAFFHPPLSGVWKGGIPPNEANFFKWLVETSIKPTADMLKALHCIQPAMSPTSVVYPIILNGEMRERMVHLLLNPSELLISLRMNAMPTIVRNEFGHYQAGPHESLHVDSQMHQLERAHNKPAHLFDKETEAFQFLGNDQSKTRVQSVTFTQVYNDIRREVFGDTTVITPENMHHVGFWWSMVSPVPTVPM